MNKAQKHIHSLKKKKVLVIGLGISGRSAAQFLLHHGAEVLAVDRNEEYLSSNDAILSGLRQKGMVTAHDISPLDISPFDLVVVSPGVPQTHPLYKAAQSQNKEIIGEMELACRFLTRPVLAITGTNGKTTTTLLVTHVLNFNGKKALALGNVGVPITSELLSDKLPEIYVVELSSYQLETMESQVIDAGVILNVTPDHLDRYSSMETYARAKFRMQECLKPHGQLYLEKSTFNEYGNLLNRCVARTYGYASTDDLYTDKKDVFWNGKKEFSLPEMYSHKESHDVENLLAAYALCREMGISGKQFAQSLPSFKKPAHRLEFVKSIKGVDYYDDSKGTNIDAVIRAVRSFAGKDNIILIAGGVDKGASYHPWLQNFDNKVKYICTIGEAAPKMQKELSHKFHIENFSSLEKAINHASSLANSGDIVLLSPGCSSFDMFKDYAHRGNEFKRIVQQLG